MLNRRFLRVKTFQALYAVTADTHADTRVYERNLVNNLDKTYELYIFLLSFAAHFKAFVDEELETERNKHFPRQTAIDQLEAFAGNTVLIALSQNPVVLEKVMELKLNWNDSRDFLKKLFPEIRTHKAFVQINCGNPAQDKQTAIDLYEYLIAESELFEHYTEERYPNWEDDITLVTLEIQKIIKTSNDNEVQVPHSFFADKNEDLIFVRTLFNQTFANEKEFVEMISAKTQNWDTERIAQVDMLLMKMCLCEMLYFSTIPVKVSMNEYLELAKLYSSPHSHTFINGILDKIQIDLRKQNRIKKTGRGLVE